MPHVCPISALGFLGGLDGKEFTCNAGDLNLIPVLGRSSVEGNGYLTLVFLPAVFHGQRSLAGYTVHGLAKESGMTEHLTLSLSALSFELL